MRKQKIFLSVIAFACISFSNAQQISNIEIRDAFRNQQLQSGNLPPHSFTLNRNLVALSDMDSALGVKPFSKTIGKAAFKTVIQAMPLQVTQQYNSAIPYDWNQAPFIPAKGYQVMASAGLGISVGKHISIQLAPQIMYASNPYFETFYQQLGSEAWSYYYRFLNTSDIPERFGPGSYQKVLPGQSSIRYNTRNMSFGISTENLWWGPGWRNALIMTTNAPGFLHATIETRKPIQTRIGSFEGQVIGGKLDSSGIALPRIYSSYNGSFLYQPKMNDWRYMTGMILTWQPKWTPGFFIGLAKASYLYGSDISNPLDILPLQGFFGRVRTKAEREGKKASMGSFFARYVMPKEKAEIYMEYGRKDLSLMPWNIIQAEAYRRAYVAGFRKLFPARSNANIQLAAEFTQLEAPTAELIHSPDSWYTHFYVRQGYTQMGRTIGAGIGPGSNSQTLELAWVKGLKKLGLRFERLRHNSDFYYLAFERLQDFRRHWIDLSTTFQANWDYKRFLINAQLAVVRTYNYEWLIVQVNPISPSNYFVPGNEVLNLSGRVGISYRF